MGDRVGETSKTSYSALGVRVLYKKNGFKSFLAKVYMATHCSGIHLTPKLKKSNYKNKLTAYSQQKKNCIMYLLSVVVSFAFRAKRLFPFSF